MKIYRGRRLGPRENLPRVSVTVSESEGENDKPLKHRVYHSPTGFEFGYGGSGPADLARSILWDHLGKEPSPALYQEFKWSFVACWGDEWQISSLEIQDWMDTRGL